MDDATPPNSIIASSSSSITMDVIQSSCKRPGRCVIGHPFNPPHVVPAVEVVGGAKASEDTIQRTMAFCADIGKKPVRLYKALPRQVANRFQAALYKEVLYLLKPRSAESV
jgi:carnitine 3-dehydrogenase